MALAGGGHGGRADLGERVVSRWALEAALMRTARRFEAWMLMSR
jgi:hypothetical protein